MLQRRILYDETQPADFTAVALDLSALRVAFAAMMERAAHAVQVAGYEQDDAVIDRRIVCRREEGQSPTPSRVRLRDGAPGGPTVEVSADWMSDGERMIQHILRSVAEQTGAEVAASEVRIVAIRVTATLERWT